MSSWKQVLTYDVKECLQRIIESKQRKNPRFSQRAFANQIGLSSTTLNEILKGKRGLSKKTIAKLKHALEQEVEFKEVLEASTSAGLGTFHIEPPELTNTASTWYHLALLELAATDGFKEDSTWIAQRLGIAPGEAIQALSDLLRIGQIKRNHDNQLVVTYDNTIKVSDEESRAVLIKTTQENIIKTHEAVGNLPSDERFCGTVTIASSKEDLDYIQTRSVEFLRECHDYLSRAGVAKTEVFLFSIGFVPLTKEER